MWRSDFRQAPVFEPPPMPLQLIAVIPGDQDRADDHEFGGDKRDLSIRMVDKDAGQRQRDGDGGEQEVEYVGAAIDERIKDGEVIRGAIGRQQNRSRSRDVASGLSAGWRNSFPIALSFRRAAREGGSRSAAAGVRQTPTTAADTRGKGSNRRSFSTRYCASERRAAPVRQREDLLDRIGDGRVVGGSKSVLRLGIGVRGR